MQTAETERVKYTRMWTEVPGYRNHSPGEKLANDFLARADWQPGESLLDAGSGTGRASRRLAEAGLNVFMLDITRTATDAKISLPFVEACLWALPFKASFNWVYCCDVLEHIPTDKVDAVLDNLAAATSNGAFLQIALWADGFGRRINDVLHLTVQPAGWWLDRIMRRWNDVTSEGSGDGRLIVLTGEHR